jgi:hypothetical protein
MIKQWKEILDLKGDVGCTSLVTCIAKKLGLLENASIVYIDDIPRWLIDYEYFNQVHMLKKGKNRKLVMMYMDYTNEFPLPDRTLGLYAGLRLSLICRERRKHITGALLQDLHTTRSPGTMVMIQFPKDLPSLTMQARTSRVLPACTSPSMLDRNLPTYTSPSILVGGSPLLSTLSAPGIRAQVRNGRMATSTTISSSTMKKS